MANHELLRPFQSKDALRRKAIMARDALAIEDRLEWDQLIAQRLLSLPQIKAASGPISAYWPISSEVDPRPVLEDLSARGIMTCLPARPSDCGLIFRVWEPWQPLVPAGFGTLAPPEGACEVSPTILLVPLVAFDRSGQRIGYGKGHYDRTFARLDALKDRYFAIGLAYHVQEVAAIPAEPHDRQLDVIVTERETITLTD